MNLISKKSRYTYLDVIRIMSCIMIIFIHVAAIDWANFPAASSEWFIMNAFDCVGIVGVPLFFMISGALILCQDRELSLRHLWARNIPKMLFAYFLTLFCYNAIPFLKGWVPIEPYYIKTDLIESVLLERGIYHLWFLPVIIVLYMLAPILKSAFNTSKICEYYMILFAIFGGLIPLILCFDIRYKVYLNQMEEKFGLFMLTGYIGYFVLGHYLHDFIKSISRRKILITALACIASNTFTILTCFLDGLAKNAPSTIVNNPLSLNGLISAASIFILVREGCGKMNNEKLNKVLSYISSLTLGIYLVHPFVISNILTYFHPEYFICNYFLLILIRIIVVFLVSGSLTAAVKMLCSFLKVFLKAVIKKCKKG